MIPEEAIVMASVREPIPWKIEMSVPETQTRIN